MATAMSVDELEKKEEEEFRSGPLSVLTTSVKTNSQARTMPAYAGKGRVPWTHPSWACRRFTPLIGRMHEGMPLQSLLD